MATARARLLQFMQFSNRAILASLMMLLASTRASLAAADLNSTIRFDIEPQALHSAVVEYTEQSGVQITSSAELLKGQRSPGVVGEYPARIALTKLLAGTQLAYDIVDANTVVIRSAAIAAVPGGAGSGKLATTRDDSRSGEKRSFWQRFRLTQAEGNPSTQGERSGTRNSEAEGSSTASGEAEKNRIVLEEIVVVGSRLRRGVNQEGPAPVIAFDRKRIEQLGVADVGSILEYLPQQPFARPEQGSALGDKIVNFRGLGVGASLVLINGRRTVTSAAQASGNYFDLNTIPLAAVERIEVLSDSASAVYGADAVGGVVNVILKRNLERPTLDLHYGAASGGGDERRISLAAGSSGERLRGSLILDAYDRDFLLGEERDLYANQDFRRFGSLDRRSTNTNPGNITSLLPGSLPGLSAPFAAVPEGSSGVGLTPADFVANAGTLNRESLARYVSILPETQRLSAAAFGELTLTDTTRAFAEILFSDRDAVSRQPPPQVIGLVPATNPFNPFGVPVIANFLLTSLGPFESEIESRSVHAATGLQGLLGSWEWEASVMSTREHATFRSIHQLDFTRLALSLASVDPAQSLNVFQDGPGGSAALLESLAPTTSNDDRSKMLQAGGFLRGKLFDLPGGPVEVVAGSEARSEEVSFELVSANIILPESDRKVWAGYSEVRLPLIRDGDLPLLKQLGVTLAGRYDHYDDFGGTFNPQYGLEWKPFEMLLVRGSVGRAFRPPSLYQLHQPPSTRPGIVFDPRRGNEAAPITVISGGNPDLDPEVSKSWAAGFVFALPGRSGPRIGASYWKVDFRDQVRSLNPLAAENVFPDLIVRADPTSQDIAAGRPGRLVSVDFSNVNFGRLLTSGVDLDLSDSFETRYGAFGASILATWLDQYRAAETPNTPAIERVGVANLAGSFPKWRATTTLSWDKNGTELALTGRWRAAYDDAVSAIRTGRTIPSQTLVDLQASVDLGRSMGGNVSLLRALRVRAGVRNLFDEEPDFSQVGGVLGQGYDLSQADTVQRFGYVTLSKAF